MTLILGRTKALLPVFYRPLGYVILFVSLFVPFLSVMQGMVTGSSLLSHKGCTKLLVVLGTMMVLFVLLRNEGHETEIIQDKATRNAIFLTVFSLFGGIFYRVATGDIVTVDTSSFLISLIIDVLCLEFGMEKVQVGKIFRR